MCYETIVLRIIKLEDTLVTAWWSPRWRSYSSIAHSMGQNKMPGIAPFDILILQATFVIKINNQKALLPGWLQYSVAHSSNTHHDSTCCLVISQHLLDEWSFVIADAGKCILFREQTTIKSSSSNPVSQSTRIT